MICIICEMECEHFQKLYNNYLHYNCAIKMDPEKLYFLLHPNFMKKFKRIAFLHLFSSIGLKNQIFPIKN